MKPHANVIFVIPCRLRWSSWCSRNGTSTIGNIGLGRVSVNGCRRVPRPPTRMMACTSVRLRLIAGATSRFARGCAGTPDTLIHHPRSCRLAGREQVATVDQERRAHHLGEGGEVEL